MSSILGRRTTAALVLLWAAAVAFATLQPNRSPGVEPTFACLICGERGWADALLNVIMFLPLGALLALRATPPRYAALVAFLLSTLIEGAQLMIPGRDPSLGDILFNTVGGLCGYAIAGTIVRQLRVDRGWPPFVTAAGALGIIGATGYLLEPVLPNTGYHAQWTPNLGHLEWYRGRVRSASLGGIELRPPRIDDSPRVRRLLLRGERLDVHALAGAPVPGLAPLFSIYDGEQREIMLIGPDREDLVLRVRTRAAAWRLDQPDLRLRGAFVVGPGDTLRVAAWRESGTYCLVLNDVRRCGVAFTVGRGWGLLLYVERWPGWLKSALDAGWLAAWLALVGWTGTARRALVAGGAAIGIGLGILAPLMGLATNPVLEWGAAAAGLAAGIGVRAAFARGLGGTDPAIVGARHRE